MSDYIKPFEIRYTLNGACKSVFYTEPELQRAYVVLSRRGAVSMVMKNRNTAEEIFPSESAKFLA
jgi:hypothetical protein